MNQYQAKNIINLAVAGHGGAGKTSLAEAMLLPGRGFRPPGQGGRGQHRV